MSQWIETCCRCWRLRRHCRREVQTARNLFIKKNVVLRVHDEGLNPMANSPINRAPSSVSKIARKCSAPLSVAVLHNHAIFEHQTDVGKVIALVTGGRVVLHDPVD